MGPKGSTSWVPIGAGNVLPLNAIQGGSLPQGTPSYICRTYHSAGNLIAGKFGDKKCFYEVGKFSC